jgi:hypothetical protein
MVYAAICTMVLGLLLEVRNEKMRLRYGFQRSFLRPGAQGILLLIMKALSVGGSMLIGLLAGQPFSAVLVALSAAYLIASALEHNPRALDQLAYASAHYRKKSAEVMAVALFCKSQSSLLAQCLLLACASALLWHWLEQAVSNPKEAVLAFSGACVVLIGLFDLFFFGVHRKTYKEVLHHMGRRHEVAENKQ